MIFGELTLNLWKMNLAQSIGQKFFSKNADKCG